MSGYIDDMEAYSGKDKTYTTMDMTAIHCPASYFSHTHTHTHTKYRNMDITFTHTTFFPSPALFNELIKKRQFL